MSDLDKLIQESVTKKKAVVTPLPIHNKNLEVAEGLRLNTKPDIPNVKVPNVGKPMPAPKQVTVKVAEKQKEYLATVLMIDDFFKGL